MATLKKIPGVWCKLLDLEELAHGIADYKYGGLELSGEGVVYLAYMEEKYEDLRAELLPLGQYKKEVDAAHMVIIRARTKSLLKE